MSSRAALLALLACSLASAVEPFEAVEPHMGTLVRIKLYAVDSQQAKSAFRAAFDRIAQLDQALSDYRPDSELNRICRAAAGQPVKAGPDLLRVLEASRQLAEETGGAFDVTLGPVIRLWRQARRDHRLPAAEALKEAAARSGFRKLHIDAAAGTVTLDQAGHAVGPRRHREGLRRGRRAVRPRAIGHPERPRGGERRPGFRRPTARRERLEDRSG